MKNLDLSGFQRGLERGKVVIADLFGVSALCYGKYVSVPKLDKEKPDDYERRTWMERLHYDEEDNIIIPPFALKNMMSTAASYLGKKIQGKGNHTYTKHFEGGIMVDKSSLVIHRDNGTPIKKSDVKGDWRMVPSDGKKGGTKRVEKCFPVIPLWKTTAEFILLDNVVTPDIFAEHLIEAGWYVGLMSFRPRNGGINGRFQVESIKVVE